MPNSNEVFKAFESINVLIIGDVMLDRYLTGKVNRISPEAPVPIVEWEKDENRLGGAANVALNIRALGATPYLCSVIGEDLAGKEFLQIIDKEGISKKTIISSNSRITTTKTRVLAQGQHLLRIDKEEREDLTSVEFEGLKRAFLSLLGSRNIHVVLFQDYNKGVLSVPFLKMVLSETNARNIPTVVDPKFKNFWAYENVTLFKPNLKEIQEALDFEVIATKRSLNKAAKIIQSKLNNRYTIITLSEKGLYLYDGEDGFILPTMPRNIADVCGAGDTVISIAALGVGTNLNLSTIGLLSNLAGGQVCEKVGVVHVDKDILHKEFARELTNQIEFF